MKRQVVLLVGTKKGLYILRGDTDRKKWTQEGPFIADPVQPRSRQDLADLQEPRVP